MRSSNKSRSRNKNQNRRQSTNVVNRVFDSSGPEGKVRGTPQQIVEKYQSLARDAQLSGDRVAAEAFQQYAEHYLRLLNVAMREQNQRREAHEAQQAQHAQRRDVQQSQQPQQSQPSTGEGEQPDSRPDTRAETRAPEPQKDTQPEPVEPSMNIADALPDLGRDSGLVETPEGRSKPRRKKVEKPKSEPQTEKKVEKEASPEADQAAE